jgi:glycerol uptake facilitator-like aquaporin
MARQKATILPHTNEKVDGAGHNRLAALHAKGPLAWNVRKAEQTPARLAIKNHFIACVGEYVGTTLFLLLALGATNVANIPTTSVTGATAEGEKGTTVAAVNTSSLLYIALAFGFSLAVNAWIFFRVSGGLFNPAVSLGMALVGALTPLRACLLTVSQILGGITGEYSHILTETRFDEQLQVPPLSTPSFPERSTFEHNWAGEPVSSAVSLLRCL